MVLAAHKRGIAFCFYAGVDCENKLKIFSEKKGKNSYHSLHWFSLWNKYPCTLQTDTWVADTINGKEWQNVGTECWLCSVFVHLSNFFLYKCCESYEKNALAKNRNVIFIIINTPYLFSAHWLLSAYIKRHFPMFHHTVVLWKQNRFASSNAILLCPEN